LLTSAASVVLAFVPTVSTETATDGIVRAGRESLIESQGWSVAVILAVPVLISVVPLLVPSRHRFRVTIGSAILLVGCAVLGAASIGVFYLPGVAVMVAATVPMAVVVKAGTGGYR
jgi:ABC-type cobalamin transport system permease subunit